jgi:hypothetical protein
VKANFADAAWRDGKALSAWLADWLTDCCNAEIPPDNQDAIAAELIKIGAAQGIRLEVVVHDPPCDLGIVLPRKRYASDDTRARSNPADIDPLSRSLPDPRVKSAGDRRGWINYIGTRSSAGDVVCDCVAEADLGVTAAASLLLAAAVWVGSAGLAGALAALAAPAGLMHPFLPAHPGGVLTVVGSLAEISRLQAWMLAESGLVQHVLVAHETLLVGPQSPAWRAARDSLSEGLMAGRDILLEIAVVPEPDLSRGPEVVAGLAALVATAATSLGALVVTGGETACALLSGFGIHGIRLIDEVEPGVALGMTVGAHSFPVVTKAGGFGNADTLRRCLGRLGH